MTTLLTVCPHGPGSWDVVRAGLIVATARTEEAAVASALRTLSAEGGTLTVMDQNGGVRLRRDVPAPGATGPTAADRLEQAADVVDKATGRAPIVDLPSLEGKVRELDANILVPPSLRDHPVVRTTHAHISAGAAWIGLVAAIAGGGTFAGVVGPAVASSESKATVGDYLDFGTAFFATFAMCAALAVVVYAFHRGVTGFPLVFAFLVTSIIACYLSLQWGLHDPDPAKLLGIKPGNPLTTAFGYLGVYFQFYGPVPFLTGLGIGVISGHLAYRIAEPGPGNATPRHG